MNTKDNIENYNSSVDKMIAGIDKVSAVLRPTYGARGNNVIIESSLPPFHEITNDGKLITDSIKLADPVENIGANILKEATDKAERESGDGRKTTSILTQAILKEARKAIGFPLEIKQSLNEALDVINQSIDNQKKEITVDDIKSVATIASENDHIGQLLQEIYQSIGKDGIVEVDNSNLPETFYEITEGVRLRGAKCLGQYSYTEQGKAVYNNPKILITKDKITSINQLETTIKTISKNEANELVIYCEDIDVSVASKLAYSHLSGGLKTLIIKSPILWKDWLFEDFAKMTGATIVDSKEGKTFKSVTFTDLGTCEKIISDDKETRVIGIKGIQSHIDELIKESAANEQLKIRAAWLNTKVATLKVGANSESELSYISKKAKDACHASYLALQEGVVPGGGICLLNATKDLPDTIGGGILREALKAPVFQIMANAGVSQVNLDIPEDFGGTRGYDAKVGRITDMVEAGIVDPALVIKNAVKNAVSIASTIITSGGIITLPKTNENSRPMPSM